MKKFIMFMLACCLIAPATITVSAEASKEVKKEVKQKMKEFKKDGKKLFGTSRSMEVVLTKHFQKLDENEGKVRDITGICTKCKSKNVGHQMAINNACITYAQQAGSQVQGRVVSDIAGDGVDAGEEFEHFYAAYERQVEKEIKGEMEESFSTIKENPDGTYEIESYFIINEDAASKARIRAMENALNESTAAQRHAQKISDFVNQRVAGQ